MHMQGNTQNLSSAFNPSTLAPVEHTHAHAQGHTTVQNYCSCNKTQQFSIGDSVCFIPLFYCSKMAEEEEREEGHLRSFFGYKLVVLK